MRSEAERQIAVGCGKCATTGGANTEKVRHHRVGSFIKVSWLIFPYIWRLFLTALISAWNGSSKSSNTIKSARMLFHVPPLSVNICDSIFSSSKNTIVCSFWSASVVRFLTSCVYFRYICIHTSVCVHSSVHSFISL